MEKTKLSKLNTQNIFIQTIKYGSHILLTMSVLLFAYLSFVKDLTLDTNLQNITILALIAMVLNYLIWNSYYQNNYNKVLDGDLKNTEYSVHKRYWLARKNWKYEELQHKIRDYNKLFSEQWVQDVCDQLGLTEAQVIQLYIKRKLTIIRTVDGLEDGQTQLIKYSKYSIWNKLLINRIAKKHYPKSGIKTPRDLLYILSVGKSSGSKIDVKKAETFYRVKAIKKFVMLVCGTILTTSLLYDFIDGEWKSALLNLVISLTLLFSNFFTGSINGIRGAQIKLSIAEEICEKLEEWKNEPATEVPFKIKLEEPVPIVVLKQVDEHVESSIEIT